MIIIVLGVFGMSLVARPDQIVITPRKPRRLQSVAVWGRGKLGISIGYEGTHSFSSIKLYK